MFYLPGGASTASLYMWIALISMVVGICLVSLILKVIEGVAVTSEETTFVREAEVFKTALIEFEEEKKLKLELIFREGQPPFHVKAGSVATVKFGLRLVRGVEATNSRVLFYTPPGFDFPGHETYKQLSDSSTPDYITTEIGVKDVHKGLWSPGTVALKAPTEPNSFTIFYRMISTGFSSDRREFEVVVE